jgi:hypothetical protein
MRLDIEGVLNGLADLGTRATVAMNVYGDTAGKKIETYAKNNAKWTDRTGLSRKTIQGGSQMEGNKCVVYVAGNTQQMPFLELCHDKKYATLQPSIDALSPEILRGMNNLLGR